MRPGTSGGERRSWSHSATTTVERPPTSRQAFEDSPDVVVRADRKRVAHAGTCVGPGLAEDRDVSKTRAMPPRQISQDSADGRLGLPEVARFGRSTSAKEPSDSKVSSGSMNSIKEEDGKFSRRLSFIDCSTEDLDDHFKVVGADWFKHFWHGVLTLQPLCRALCNRSFANWVSIFNRWQAAGKWSGQGPDYMNTNELQEWLAAPLTRVVELAKLFDPSGYAKVSMTKASKDHNKVRVPVAPLISSCLIMSHTMSTRQKLQFLLGMFDLDDKDALSITEFASMWVSLVRGLGSMFGIKETPPPKSTAIVAKKIFEDLAVDEMLSKNMLEDLLSGKIISTLGLPFALVMQRFSVDSSMIDPDSYNEESKRFRLSHKKPMENPLESFPAFDTGFLTRMEVVTVRDVYQYCSSIGDFGLSHRDAEKAIKKAINVELWCSRMSRALEEANAVQGSGARFYLNIFLKKHCPKATMTHLHMFQRWLEDFDQLQEKKKTLERSKEVLLQLRQYNAMPIMTERIRQELIAGFNLVDRCDTGRICTLDLQASMEIERGMAKSMMKYFDINGDGSVDMEEYIAAMCPQGHRMPSQVEGRIFDLLLSAEVEMQEDFVSQQEALFNKPSTERKQLKLTTFLQKQVPGSLWDDWNTAWQVLDSEKLGYITRAALKQSRAMQIDVSDFLFDLLADTNEAEGISQERFLSKLLQAARFRRPPVE